MSSVNDISFYQLLSTYLFVLLLLGIVKLQKISKEKEILISSFRMTFQLILTGYILSYVLEHPSPWITLIIFIMMEIFAIFNIYQREKNPIQPPLKKIIAFSMIIGSCATLLYFLFAAVKIKPYYNPQYVIPLAGMLIGNSMTGISLGVNRLLDGMQTRRNEVETAMMLGASPKQACQKIINHAFESAIMPTIHSMVGMGIVFLPGMMTGQILSGTSPSIAIKYQIAIMLGILGSVTITVLLCIQLGYKTFFNEREQFSSTKRVL